MKNAQNRLFHVQQTIHSSSPQRQTVTAAWRDGVWKRLYMAGQHIRKPEYWADFTHFNKDVLQKPSNHIFRSVVYKAVFLFGQVSELQVKPSSPHRGVFSFINIAVCLSDGSSSTFITLYALKWQHTRLIRAEEPPTARWGLCVQITKERRGARPLIWSQTHQDAAGSHLKQLQRWWSETGWETQSKDEPLVAAQPLFWKKSQGLKRVDAWSTQLEMIQNLNRTQKKSDPEPGQTNSITLSWSFQVVRFFLSEVLTGSKHELTNWSGYALFKLPNFSFFFFNGWMFKRCLQGLEWKGL